MQINMAGIDHVHASIDQRETFSLTKVHAAAMAKKLTDSYELDGCLILSTCNRTEFWVSGADKLPLSNLTQVLPLSQQDYARFFTERNGKDAVEYLFRLACGMQFLNFWGKTKSWAKSKKPPVWPALPVLWMRS